MRYVNLRIGWLDCDSLRETIAGDGDIAQYARAMYLSERDCRDDIVQSVEADIPRNPLTVNLRSRNRDRYLSLTEATCGLGYEPRDDSNEVFD